MKKRMIAIAMTLAMMTAMAVPVSAAELDSDTPSGTTNLSIGVNPTYSVTIPTNVSLASEDGGNTYTGTATITAKNVLLEEDQVINLTMEGDYQLQTEGGEYTLAYTVTANQGSDSHAVNASSSQVASFGTSTDDQTVTLTFSAGKPDYAGAYSDTVTFNLSSPVTITATIDPGWGGSSTGGF